MADWQCKQCKHENPSEEDFCDKCFAPRTASGAPRETCRTCLHRHSAGYPCHVYVVDKKRRKRKTKKWNRPRKKVEDAADGEGGSSSSEGWSDSGGDVSDAQDGSTGESSSAKDDIEEEEEEEDEDDSSEESSGSQDNEGEPKKKKGLLGLGEKLAAKAAAIAKTANQAALQLITRGEHRPPHEAPPWAKAACFKRCNCDHGVPTDSTAFVPLEEGRTIEHEAVGSVAVRTQPPVGADYDFENRAPQESMPPPLYALRFFLEHMAARTVACCAHVCAEWHRECYQIDEEGRPMHPAYTGLHFMELDSSLDACKDKIDALFFHQPPTGSGGKLFTSGQRSVTAWRRVEAQVVPEDESTTGSQGGGSQASGQSTTEKKASAPRTEISWKTAGVAVRDTAPFTAIRPVNNSIMCCSSNGSIREWSLAHEVKNTCFMAQMWEHNGYITDVTFSEPSVGFCRAHGAPAHSCFMYSVSDDRYLKVWDLSTKQCLHTVKPKISDCGTLQSVAKSDFHLYAGSSIGRIVVFALGQVCLRPEKHRCHLHDEPQWFCEQERFNHGDEPVKHMVCGGVGGSFKYLFTGARDGTIKVWTVPKKAFGHKLVTTFRHHKRAITALSVTKAHVFSASDEGHVRVWSLGTLTLQRVVRQEWRIKCIWVHHAPQECPDAGKGCLFLGLATGLVLAYPITDAV